MARKPKNRSADMSENDADDLSEQGANGPGRRDLQHHMAIIGAALQKKQDADMQLAGAYATAEECGLDKKVIKALLKLKKDDPEKTNSYFSTFIQYAKWMEFPVGTQLVFFADGTKDPEETARAEGKAAGAEGISANRNPYPEGSKLYPIWEEGRMAGQADLVNGDAPSRTKKKGAASNVVGLAAEKKKRGRPPKNQAEQTEQLN